MIIILLSALVWTMSQTGRGLTILASPPPGVTGPYFVIAEAEIYGDHVDLSAIRSTMNGQYSTDYAYVQWGTNPFYRVWSDNTLQQVYSGQMIEVLAYFSTTFQFELSLRTTFDNLKSLGAVDPTSVLGQLQGFGNMPGSYITFQSGHYGFPTVSNYFNFTSSKLYAIEGTANGYGSLSVYLNDSLCLSTGPGSIMNATGTSGGLHRWKTIEGYYGNTNGFGPYFITLYCQDFSGLSAAFDPGSSAELRTYTIVDSPGTGFILKSLSPASPVAGSTITVKVKLDPPAADNLNITDSYPNSFALSNADALLEKYKVGTGLEDSINVNVVPQANGQNMIFQINFNQAPTILQTLQIDEYLCLSYSLRVPSTAGEYSLPGAIMQYEVP
jgi:hypothetical protein